MDMCYEGTLVMPSSYAVMNEEEMTYVEGGAINIPRGLAAFALDAVLMLSPLGAAFAPLKYLGRAAGKALIKKFAGSITGILGWAISFLGGCAGSFAFNFPVSSLFGLVDNVLSCATSLGGIVSLIIDCTDRGGLDRWVTIG